MNDNYAAFTANRLAPQTAAQASQETQIVSNVFPLANPALAVRDDGVRALLWIHDEIGNPIGQGEEIHAAHWNGATWTTTSLTNDHFQDFAPQVAFDGDGDAVAVWERTNTVHISPTLDITYVRSFEIASAVWDRSTETWLSVATLTNDSLLDTSPRLERGQDGTLMALWRRGDGYDLLGTSSHPISFTYALWAGAAWSAPATALGALEDVLGMDAALYSAAKATLVYARDMDGDLLTESDTELYYAVWDGAAWSGPTPLTNDTITDTAPSLAYNSAGQPVIVWLRGQDLVAQTGWGGSPAVVRMGSTAGSFLDVQLVNQANGNLALIWQAQAAAGADAAYVIYDAANDSWGDDNDLMRDTALDESFAPALANDGTLYMAYNKVEMEIVTKTVEISPTLTITVTNVPQPVRTDLYLLSHTLGRDLAISAADIALSTPNPAPGSQVDITAVIHNLGDLAVTGGQVAFYDGDPSAGGVQIGSAQNLASPFRAATTDTVTIAWNLPSGANAHTLYVVVDPANSVSESDEANNQATVGAVLPDLTVDWVTGLQPGSDLLTAVLVNQGHSPVTTPFTVAFRASDALSGTLLGAIAITDTVGVGASVTAVLTVANPAAVPAPDNLFWVIADDGGEVAEGDESNNTDFAALNLLPDLTIDAYDIKFGSRVSVTVQNSGVVTATDVEVSVWWDGAANQTYTEAISILSAGASASVAFDIGGTTGRLWARADPNDLILESDESNNLAVRAVEVMQRIYLPLVLCNR